MLTIVFTPPRVAATIPRLWKHPIGFGNMSEPSADDEMGFLLKELLRSIKDQITGAPSTGSAEEVLLHLEQTDKNFHK